MTPEQLTTLKAAIVADSALNSQPMDGNGNGVIADAMNALAVPDFLLWDTNASTANVADAIDASKFTPVDAADGTVIQSNRLLLINVKQMNLQNYLIRERVDASKLNIRAGIRDAVIALPAGASGALISAGGVSGVTVMLALTRKATRAEKLLITSTPAALGTVTASVAGFEGTVTSSDIDAARHA